MSAAILWVFDIRRGCGRPRSLTEMIKVWTFHSFTPPHLYLQIIEIGEVFIQNEIAMARNVSQVQIM